VLKWKNKHLPAWSSIDKKENDELTCLIFDNSMLILFKNTTLESIITKILYDKLKIVNFLFESQSNLPIHFEKNFS